MNRKLNRKTSSPFSMLAFGVVSLALSSLSAVVAQTNYANYTCDARIDYNQGIEICPKELINNGVCDNPNLDGEQDECDGQDCIDCNYHCRAFDADCFGCLNAVGCYYCSGDATCQNSELYQSDATRLSCLTPG